MRHGGLARTITIVLACGVVLLPMTFGGMVAAGQAPDAAMSQFRAPAEAFMRGATYLRFSTVPVAARTGVDDPNAMYAALPAGGARATDLALARANVSAINDLQMRMNAFYEEFQRFALETPEAAALVGKARALKMKVDRVAMIRQTIMSVRDSAQNGTGGMLASAAPGGCLLAQDVTPEAAAVAENECMIMLSEFLERTGSLIKIRCGG